MAKLGSITLVGKSGKPYKFRAYPLGTIFKKGFAAVYAITQRTPRQAMIATKHKVLHLGLSADLRQPDSDTPDARHAAANCICVHGEQSELERLRITQDLLSVSSMR